MSKVQGSLKKHLVEGKGEAALVQWLPLVEPMSLGEASESGDSD